MQITSTDDSTSKDMDNLLKSLRQYYDSVRTKRQLTMPVPAGFCQQTNLQQLFQSFTPPRKAQTAVLLGTPSDSTATSIGLSSDINSATTMPPSPVSLDIVHLTTDASSIATVPILRCVDKASVPLPSR
jgi:conjugal transfer/entry exclusion protein